MKLIAKILNHTERFKINPDSFPKLKYLNVLV